MCAEITSGAATQRVADRRRAAVGVAVDLELDEDGQAEAQPRAVELRAVAGDDAVVLERAQPAQARRRREVELLGEAGVGDPAVALEDLQHPAVDDVQWHDLLLRWRSTADHCAPGRWRGASEHQMPPDPRNTACMTGTLSTRSATALYVGAVLGPGVLIVPALAAEAAGPASVLAWAALLALSAPLAMTFAALGVRQPEAGGTAAYARAAFGPAHRRHHRLVVPRRRRPRRARRGADRRLLRGRAASAPAARARSSRRRGDDGARSSAANAFGLHATARLQLGARRPARGAAARRGRDGAAGEPGGELDAVRAARLGRGRHGGEPADALVHRLGGRVAPGRRAARPGTPAPARDLRRARRRGRALPRPGRRDASACSAPRRRRRCRSPT